MAAFMLGITALVSLLTAVTVSPVTQVEKGHAASSANPVSKKGTGALPTQGIVSSAKQPCGAAARRRGGCTGRCCHDLLLETCGPSRGRGRV